MAANAQTHHPVARIPRATYRLQFNRRFRLKDALALVPYLEELGISHVYASPLFRARPQSEHGYDVCDFGQLNPELGTEADLMKLAAALRERGMGMMLDMVPNHMGIWTPENRWWWDVLEKGPASPFAEYFDIDWQTLDPELRGKVLAPVLADRYERVLQRGELSIVEHDGAYVLSHFEQLLPLTPRSLPEGLLERNGPPAAMETAAWLKELNENWEMLDKVVRQQYYLPACWREADTRLNYRRFFSVATLAGIRVEDERVFNDTHSLVRSWVKHGWVDGLRVDHPDGLRDPGQYLHRLRELAPSAWIVVEKILEPGETLPGSWPVAGTTGYDFMNLVNGLFVASKAQQPFTDFFAHYAGGLPDCVEMVRSSKLQVLNGMFTAEVNRLSGLLKHITRRHERFLNFTAVELRDGLLELAACFPIYRTYVRVDDGAASKSDIAWIERAEAAARRQRPDRDPKLFDLLHDLLFLRLRGETEDEFVARFQQLTGPVMAKGVEDSVLYRFNRLVSLNEVGSDPWRFGASIEEFHQFCRCAQSRRPNGMLATSTHDTKRSEDVRARINVLSEIPDKWFETVQRWSAINEQHRSNGQPDRNTEYLFYQTLVGAWPMSLERALAYIEKASKEAGLHTSWEEPDTAYDEALKSFIKGALGDAEFTGELNRFLAPLVDAGFINSLAQTLLKLTAPGVPDIYQGCDLWDLSLVDPDNRRTVDFELRQRLLAEAGALTAEEIWQRRDRGLSKLWLIRKVLTFRRRRPELFDGSSWYDALSAGGAKAAHVVAFVRGNTSISVVPRLTLTLNGNWEDTTLELPAGSWRNELTGEDILEAAASVAALFRKFPVALLARKDAA